MPLGDTAKENSTGKIDDLFEEVNSGDDVVDLRVRNAPENTG